MATEKLKETPFKVCHWRGDDDYLQKMMEGDYFFLTYAETGIAPLSIYGDCRGVSSEVLFKFSAEVNDRDEIGSLQPSVPIGAIPRRYIRDTRHPNDLAYVLSDFLTNDLVKTQKRKLVIDFTCGPVPRHVMPAINIALERCGNLPIDELLLAGCLE